MITGLDPKETLEFVSVLDKGENPTKFILGMLTGEDRVVLMSKFEPEEIDPAYYYKLVRKGLKGIKNIKTKGGEIKDFNEITDEVLNLIPVVVMKELFQKLLVMNFITEQETKN
jgi:hypothetical protein